MGRVFSGAVLAFLSPLAAAQNQVNMSPGVTEIGADIFELHMLIMWICVVIGVAVFAVMFYSINAHRKSKRQKKIDKLKGNADHWKGLQ
jgi:cytochrome c oxidase subunit 2